MIEELRSILGEEWVVTEKEKIEGYMHDECARGVIPPASEAVVVKPASAKEIAGIMRIASANKVPVYPRGGGTGLVGGAVPTRKGIVLSLERMKGIDVDERNMMCTAEAGVTLAQLEEEVDRHDLFFPPHPGDEGAQVGGLVACNAGGSRAVKYGVMRNYVKGLEIVLADGSVLSLGGKLLKNNTGYDLMDLFIGSEGTLGVITKAVLKLYPKPGHSVTMIVPFTDRHSALAIVPEMLQRGITPLALEYVEKDTINLSAQHLSLKWPCENGNAQLMIIAAEDSEDVVYAQCEEIAEIAQEQGALEPVIADRRHEQEEILKIRSSIYTSLQSRTLDILDISVPPSEIGTLMDDLDAIAEEYRTKIPLYGHAADGNLHAHIMDDIDASKLKVMKEEVYRKAITLGGTITAEHGIGKVRRDLLSLCLSSEEIALMNEVKRIFDPNGVLNPECKI
jgi:glycolate oxidase